MTDPISLTLRDLIAFAVFLSAIIGGLGRLWWAVYRIKHNALENLASRRDVENLVKRFDLLEREFIDFKDKYYLERERDAENRGKIHATLKNLQADAVEFKKKLNKAPG